MHQRWAIIFTIIQMVAVPFVAFLIRMVVGNVHNEDERIVSDAIRDVIHRHLKITLET